MREHAGVDTFHPEGATGLSPGPNALGPGLSSCAASRQSASCLLNFHYVDAHGQPPDEGDALPRSRSFPAFPLVQTGIGTVKRMLVPRPAAVWISNFALICAALVRIFRSPKPSLFSRLLLEIPDPLSLTDRMRSGGFQRSVTFTIVGWACRTALLIASWAKRSNSCWIPGGKISSGMTSNWKTQRNRPATFECSTKRCNVVVNPDSSIALEPKRRMDLRASANPNLAISSARRIWWRGSPSFAASCSPATPSCNEMPVKL